MKAKALLYAAVAAIISLSCTREVEMTDNVPNGGQLEIHAAWEEANPAAGSRTVLAENGTDILWSSGDEIKVFYGSRFSGRFTSSNTEPQSLVTFSGTLTMVTGSMEQGNESSRYWAVYPYNNENSCDNQSVTMTLPHRQKGKAGTFADKFFPAIAVSTTPDLAFYNVCGGARFSVTQEGIYKVVFKSNDGSPMAGKVKVGFGEDNKPQILEVATPVDSVVIWAPGGSFVPGENYFAAMLPQSHMEGITVTLITTGQKAVKTLPSVKAIHRATFGILNNIDAGLVFEDTADVPEMVDLGLPSGLKWASFNLGATKPEECGQYFAWGETEPKEDYSWSTYRWCMNGSSSQLTKYCNQSSNGYNGFTDNKMVLDWEDDAAAMALGGSWHMPTYTEWHELIDNCTWNSTTLNGVYGEKFTSNRTGYTDKWIFLPAAGYWLSSLPSTDNPRLAYRFECGSILELDGDYRCYGRPVRPVYGEVIRPLSIMLNQAALTLRKGESATLKATVVPSTVAAYINWTSSDTAVAFVDSHGVVTGVSAGKVVITATTVDGGLTAECSVTVRDDPPVTDLGKTFMEVDLGLPSGLKWASFNLGATKPEEYGNYYAWGETAPKSDYSRSTYKFALGSGAFDPFSKYVTDWSYGTVDNKTVLDREDDAAAVALGGSWRMPKQTEQDELRNNCTWTWTSLNGVNGSLVTGPNGNSIFLPAAGYRSGSSLKYAGSSGYYWSSYLNPTNPVNARYMYFTSGVVDLGSSSRYSGRSVRPVAE